MEKQSSPMGFLLLEEVQFLEVNDDALSQWEFVNVHDSEEGGENDEDGDSVQGGFCSWDSSVSCSISPNNGPIEGIHYRVLDPDDVHMKGHLEIAEDGNVERHFDDVDEEKGGCQFNDGDADGYRGGKIDDEEEEDNDDDYNGYDLDDELVPWSVSSKIGRQRIRKLGKRACSKMTNSKKSPYLFVRPGCVRGKHGLGLKHNF